MVSECKELVEVISLYQTQYSLVDAIWGYFSVATIAVAGFVLGSEKATKSMKEPMAILGAYLVFCIGNHSALASGQRQLHQLATLVQEVSKEKTIDLSSFVPLDVCDIKLFHAGVVVAVCIGVLTVAKLRQDT